MLRTLPRLLTVPLNTAKRRIARLFLIRTLMTAFFLGMLIIAGCGGGGGEESTAVAGDGSNATSPVLPAPDQPGNTPPVAEVPNPEPPPVSETPAELNRQIDDSVQQLITAQIDGSPPGTNQFDAVEISDKLLAIDGVAKAAPNPTGIAIELQRDDGSYTNFLLGTVTNDELFEQVPRPSAALQTQNFTSRKVKTLSLNAPRLKADEVTKRALLLAPFSTQGLGDNIPEIERLLSNVGFEVTVHANGDAGPERFRGTYLETFDFVYIETHGSAGRTADGTRSTILTTGVDGFSSEGQAFLSTQPFEQLKKLADSRVKIATGLWIADFLGVSAHWIKQTSSGPDAFKNTLIVVAACESAFYDNGDESMATTLFSLGAGGYVGFDTIINRILLRGLMGRLVAELAAGESLKVASDRARSDPGFANIAFVIAAALRIPTTDARSLDDSQRDPNTPFYLIEPELSGTVGEIEINPGSGPPGTRLQLTFTADPTYLERIDTVRFRIGTSGSEGILERITTANSRRWRSTLLQMPPAESYPKKVPFNIEVLDGNGVIFGATSISFQLTSPVQ